MKREVKIVIETERRIEVRNGPGAVETRCRECETCAPMLSLEMAAAIAGVSVGAINHWLEAGELHFQLSEAGLPRICQKSLFDQLRRLNFLPKPDGHQRLSGINRGNRGNDKETEIIRR